MRSFHRRGMRDKLKCGGNNIRVSIRVRDPDPRTLF
jgi:hypothetical protein